ncbi:MAG: hypothetical protein KJO95_12845 [Gammaproteobacteria bacterium]|nr:hypothetical protein [Gammaproteobacteria bacterium]MBU2676641.1 hypothetical protein [Gammaproteobacteria bacterium]NNL50375.1 hypothetical protein [Woeseiaceae bacterium]
MKAIHVMLKRVFGVAATALVSAGLIQANATEPCGDFGECKVLIEINSSDGDIGFHWLGDADDLRAMRITDPNGAKVFENRGFGPLREQKLTETFGESAEPLCWPDPEADPEDLEDIVSLRDFRDIWEPGYYVFRGKGDGGEKLFGETELTYDLPGAPQDLDFDGSMITWIAGNDLGNCAPLADGDGQETIPYVLDIIADPASVAVAAFEVVMEPDVDDGAVGNLKYTIRVPGDTFAVEVPSLYLASLPDDTPVKIEVGAIGEDDNATFTEEDGFCVNEVVGCPED